MLAILQPRVRELSCINGVFLSINKVFFKRCPDLQTMRYAPIFHNIMAILAVLFLVTVNILSS